MRNDVKAIQLVWLSKTGLTNLNSGEGGSNLVDIKKFRYGGQEFPYVSGQAMRFYLKEAIRRHLRPEEACVADEQGETCGRIAECVLCDLFGFMTTVPDVGALTRVSPVKVSPAMGLLPLEDTMVTDFLTRRHRGAVVQQQAEMRGDIVNVELAVNIYKAGICIDTVRVGREEELVQVAEQQSAKKGKAIKTVRGVQLKDFAPEQERFRRITLLLDAIKDFSDYSKQARLLTDFTPDFVLVALQHNYSHRLQKAIELCNDGTAKLNVERLRQIITEVQEELVAVDSKPALWAGMVEGIVDNADEVKQALQDLQVPILTPRQAIDAAKKALGLEGLKQ
ncbi:MAG: type I-B CRISPR-associated protein Cas7/Cst2/DevR [Armatimonadetes bacterium]|nr:type I-B CRISPR-associated protein Cas7/Cst2/DevR [Armatimonadota bacterium]MCX7969393.1 type I-B CRISPR-associated protein Cas7/Cst2/DevR [Armatimonadota bacterium]MDW8144022.1 type I-B CRISPR-associated protein Cas7/Cst2/DevR [Armatimonadota bacterium]